MPPTEPPPRQPTDRQPATLGRESSLGTDGVRRILIVDDEVVLRDLLAGRFRHHGFDVDECGDGAAALRMMRERVYDAVLLDIIMPVMDGFDVLTARADTQNAATPVFVLTIAAEDRSKLAQELGARLVFAKNKCSATGIMHEILQDLGWEPKEAATPPKE